MNFEVIKIFFISFLCTFLSVPIFQFLAYKFFILDTPDGVLKRHNKVTPYLGGCAVYLGFIISFLYMRSYSRELLSLVSGLTVLLLVGLLDDIYTMKPNQKFLGQLLAVGIFLLGGFSFNEIFLLKTFPFLEVAPIGVFLLLKVASVWWILSIINAFNLVDIMDGLATGIAIIALISFIVVAVFYGKQEQILYMVTFLGSLVAFFLYNAPSASIYLGDTGSLLIGGFLAIVPFVLDWGKEEASLINYIIFPTILMVPILELICLIGIRSYKCLPVYYGSPHHFISYLKRKNWNSNFILTITLIVCSLFGSISIGVASGVFNVFYFFIFVAMMLFAWVKFIYF